MPESVPIIYTGLNAARPDWKSFNKDVNSRMSQLSQQRQQQNQFDTLQKERRRKEFLESLDVDQLNSTNELLLSKKYELTKGLENYYTNSLKKSNGDPSDKDLMEARMLTGRVNQDISKLNNWAKNQQLDLKAAEANLDIYDPDKVKEKIYNWNPDKDGGYNKSKLSDVYRDVSVEEIRDRRFQKMKDPNYFATTAALSGKNVNGQQDYDDVYWNVEKGKLVADYGAQVGFLKSQTVEEGQMGTLSEIAYDKQFASASDKDKDLYKKKAKRFTGREDDAKYIYELDQADGRYFESGEFTAAKEEKVSKSSEGKKDTRTPIDLRETTVGSMASKPVPITGAITYTDKDGKEQTYNAGLNDVRLTKIYYDGSRGEWMVDGILKRGTTEEDLDEGIFSRTVNDPITMTYESVKEDVNREYNVTLPTEKKKKKAY